MTLPVFIYLCRDILCRWRENPFGLLAKGAVTGLLAGMAAIILISFHLSAIEIRRGLESAGANSVLVHEFVPRDRMISRKWMLDAIQPWNLPVCHQLDKLALNAETDVSGGIPVFLVDNDESWFLKDADIETTGVLYTDDWAAGLRMQVRVNSSPLLLTTRKKPDWLGKVASGSVLVAPREQFAKHTIYGVESYTYFEVQGGRQRMREIVSALQVLVTDSGYKGVTIRDPLTLMKQLEELETTQAVWKAAIVFGFGGTLALVLGVISFLELRERRFVCALLRSFGLHPAVIVARYAVEALVIANGVLAAVIALVLSGATWVLPSVGVSLSAIASLDTGRFFYHDGWVLLLFVNVGAFLSLIPTVLGLGRPVGRVLA